MTIEQFKYPRGGAPEGEDPRRCTAHLSDGSGTRCRRWAMENQNVCPMHGGKIPSVRRRAQLRLLDMVDLSLTKHQQILETSTDERVLLQAVNMVYNRTGLEEGSAVRDNTVLKEMLVARLMDAAGALPPEHKAGQPDPEDEIVDAEIIEESESLEDLL